MPRGFESILWGMFSTCPSRGKFGHDGTCPTNSHPLTPRILRCAAALSGMILLGIVGGASADDWPQWRGPTGQGVTSEKNLPPREGTISLSALWKTPIPGEGVSSPIVCRGRVYLTTAYAGTQRHPW